MEGALWTRLVLEAMIGIAVPIIVSIIANRKNPKKEDAEVDCSSAEAVDSYASAATKFSDQMIKLQTHINDLTGKMADLQQQLAEQEVTQKEQQKRIDELERENVDLRDVVNKLIGQLKALDQQPVAVPRVRNRTA